MNRFRILSSMIILALAISGFAVVMLAGNSTTVLLVGILLLITP